MIPGAVQQAGHHPPGGLQPAGPGAQVSQRRERARWRGGHRVQTGIF